jgi:hypothetical protein
MKILYGTAELELDIIEINQLGEEVAQCSD